MPLRRALLVALALLLGCGSSPYLLEPAPTTVGAPAPLSRQAPRVTLDRNAIATALILHGGVAQERYRSSVTLEGRVVCGDRLLERRVPVSTWSRLRQVRPGRYVERDPHSWFAREGWVSEADPAVFLVVSFGGEQRRYESQDWGGPCPLIELIAELVACRAPTDASRDPRDVCPGQ